MYVCIHIYIYIYIYLSIYIYIHIHIYTYTQIHTYITYGRRADAGLADAIAAEANLQDLADRLSGGRNLRPASGSSWILSDPLGSLDIASRNSRTSRDRRSPIEPSGSLGSPQRGPMRGLRNTAGDLIEFLWRKKHKPIAGLDLPVYARTTTRLGATCTGICVNDYEAWRNMHRHIRERLRGLAQDTPGAAQSRGRPLRPGSGFGSSANAALIQCYGIVHYII